MVLWGDPGAEPGSVLLRDPEVISKGWTQGGLRASAGVDPGLVAPGASLSRSILMESGHCVVRSIIKGTHPTPPSKNVQRWR